jgi:hypothetical protein
MNKTLYVPSCVLRETALAITTNPPPVVVNNPLQSPRPATPVVRSHPTTGGQRPIGRSPDTWPETWDTVPSSCPVCDCQTISDPYLNSARGPGWKCITGGYRHYWLVRMEPLRRYVAAHPPQPSYPWYDTPPAERQAWLEEHYHPPRLCSTAPKAVTPSNKGDHPHALDRKTESTS